MKSTTTGLGLALALAAGSTSVNAQTQYGTAPAQPQNPAASQAAPQQDAAAKITPSKGALKAIIELQQAVNANDTANIPAKAAAADAVAKTPEDRYLIAGLRYKAALAAKDEAGKAAALEALIASGKLPASEVQGALLDIGIAAYNGKQFDKAASYFERVLAATPANIDALTALAETRHSQGRANEAITLFKKAISQTVASGQKPKEDWYKRALAIAYNAKLPEAPELARNWAAAYPSEQSWRDAIRIYRNLRRPPAPVLIDLLRLGRATGALEGKDEYHAYAYTALEELAPAEAKAVVEEGIAAGQINASEQLFKEILAEANQKSQGQRERLPALASDALASPTAKMAITAANIYYGYGDYSKAAELYRAALGKTGADKDLVNLRLGMALARSGDKAGATTALNAVGGARAEVAKYWLAYLQSRA